MLQVDMAHVERVTDVVGAQRFNDGVRAAHNRLCWLAEQLERGGDPHAAMVLWGACGHIRELEDEALAKYQGAKAGYAEHMARLAADMLEGSTLPLIDVVR